MIVTKFLPGSRWYAEVVLDKKEWPPLDYEDNWLDRPIRQWVLLQCAGNTWFTYAGTILFERESDLTAFVLAWS